MYLGIQGPPKPQGTSRQEVVAHPRAGTPRLPKPDQLNCQGCLFTFTDPLLTGNGPAHATSNQVESANAPVKAAVYEYCGCIKAHMKRIVEWTLYPASPNPDSTTIMHQEPKTNMLVTPPRTHHYPTLPAP